MVKTFSFIIFFLVWISNSCAQNLSYPSYSIAVDTFEDIWVDPVSGSDSNSGTIRSSALKTINAAWQKIPQGVLLNRAYKIKLLPGEYPEDGIPNYWEDRFGTSLNPIVIQSVEGSGSVILRGDVNAFNIRYVYFIGITISPQPEGDTFHCEQCDHILLREMILNGGNRVAQETLKINQSRYIYVEDSDISGASDNNIDFVAVQYGHIARNKIHSADDWCMYVKGGSAQILIEANEIFNCGTGGFTAGQGTGFEFMTSPWLHYEAYDIKFINNIVHNTFGAGMGVNGGYNILLAHNSLYKVGRNSHTIEVVYGYRSCDGNVSQCSSNLGLGGWGTDVTGTEGEPIPNRNVFIYNNLIYNPEGYESQSANFAIYGSRNTSIGSNLPSSVSTDSNLQIKSNVIWNGETAIPVGIEEADQGCQNGNSSCNLNQVTTENYLQTHQPIFLDPEYSDFRNSSASAVENLNPSSIPSFPGGDRIFPPIAEEGNLSNNVSRDFTGSIRQRDKIGAYQGLIRGLTQADGYLLWNSFLGMVNIVELTNKGSTPFVATLTVFNTSGQAISQQGVTIAAHGQQDVILNSLSGFRLDSYGLVTIDCASTNLGARLSIYRPSTKGNNFDFAYSSPLVEPISGITNVSFNTMQPSGNLNDFRLPVSNWLAITNPDPTSSHAFTIQRYNEVGDLITAKRVNVPPFGRVDVEGGHENPGKSRIGLNQIIPDDESPYFANIIRYGLDVGVERDFQFAYPILALAGGDQTQFVPVSNGGGAQNWVEIINVTDHQISIAIEVIDNFGEKKGATSYYAIEGHSQFHFNATQSLESGASGTIKITSNEANSFIAHSLYYFFSQSRSISAMYGIKSLPESSGQITGSYNLYLGMANWLKIYNKDLSPKTATLRLYLGSSIIKEQAFTIPSLGLIELPIHESLQFNTNSDSYGQIEIVGEDISAYLLRIRPKGNEINFIFPTLIR